MPSAKFAEGSFYHIFGGAKKVKPPLSKGEVWTGPLAVPDIFLGDGAPASAIDRGAINSFAVSATGGAKEFIPTRWLIFGFVDMWWLLVY